jgi:hypothetical protein
VAQLSMLGKLWDALTKGTSPEYASGLLKFGEEGMTQEARMARAAEQGYEGPFYRWTEGGQGNVVRTPESDKGLKFGPAGYASPQPDYGARYVDQTKANVQPLMARGPLADLNEVDRVSQGLIAQRKQAGSPQWPGHQQHWAEMQDALKAEGFRGVRYGDREIASFNPEKNMRSINATFDPDAPPGLLASRPEAAVGAAVLGGGLLAGGFEEAEAGVGGKILGQVSEMGFFSPLERAVGGLSQQKGTGDQMLATIQKQAGVKPEEVQWTGLGDFLAGKPSVTKAEIEDYLLNNRVELKEISLESVNPYPYKTGDEWQAAVSAAERRRDWDEVERLHNAWETEQGHGPAGAPKFERYTTPGGSNYRELLMTMPEKTRPVSLAEVNAERAKISPLLEPIDQAQYDALVQSGEVGRVGIGGQQYRSSHYDQPNILAHTRVKDYEQDGQKILHVDEVQSDWHQAGRKKGYSNKPNEAIKEYQALSIKMANGTLTPEGRARLDELRPIVSGQGGVDGTVPDAPFKKNWHELGVRRILQEASEKGYDRVTFTTGRTQAERYDLSKQVSTVMYIPRTKSLRAFGHDGEALIAEDGVTPEKLVDYIGKEPAEKLLASEQIDASKFPHIGKNVTGHVLEGEDLKVGGEGMKGFYDNMMVKAFNKEGKKFGVKVEPYNLKTGKKGEQVWSMEIPPEMRAKRKAEGSPLFSAAPFGLLGAGAADSVEPSQLDAEVANMMGSIGVDYREDPNFDYGTFWPWRKPKSVMYGDGSEFAMPSLFRDILRGALTAERAGKYGNDEAAIKGLLESML